MAGFNKVVLIGNLTRDPEKRQLPSGQTMARLGLAVNRPYKNKQTGQMVQEVCFVDIDVWGPQAESMGQYLSKGRPVLIEGRLKFDTWKDQDGQTRTKHSVVAERVVFLGGGAAQGADMGNGGSELDIDEMVSELKTPEVKKSTAAKKEKAKPAAAADDEFNFKDTPPFESELPF